MRATRIFAALGFAFTLLVGGYARAQEDWPMYGRNLLHTFSNIKSRINPSNVANLKPLWAFSTADAVSASPTVVDGVIYVGSWDGFFYAINAGSGALIWKYQVDCDNTIVPVPPQCLAPGQTPPPRFFSLGGLITSTAAVTRGHVYFAAGKTVYDLSAADGSLVWKHVICGNPEQRNCEADPNDPTQIFSSPAVFGDLVFLGHTAGADGYRGAIEGARCQGWGAAMAFRGGPDARCERASGPRPARPRNRRI
jgi:glucose dehydrogenase